MVIIFNMLLSIRDLQAIAKSRAQLMTGNSDSCEYRLNFMKIFHRLTMTCADAIGTFTSPPDGVMPQDLDHLLFEGGADNQPAFQLPLFHHVEEEMADNDSVPDTVIVTDTDSSSSSSSSSDSDSDPDADQEPEFKE